MALFQTIQEVSILIAICFIIGGLASFLWEIARRHIALPDRPVFFWIALTIVTTITNHLIALGLRERISFAFSDNVMVDVVKLSVAIFSCLIIDGLVFWLLIQIVRIAGLKFNISLGETILSAFWVAITLAGVFLFLSVSLLLTSSI